MFHRRRESRDQEVEARRQHAVANVSVPSVPKGVRELIRWARDDLRAVHGRDPAARSWIEVLLAYPGVHAVWAHRPNHALWRRGFTVLPRAISHCNRFFTGVDIHPGAVLGHGVFIDHAMGVVIGETAVVGDECLIYQGATLGGTSLERKVRHPRLGRGVVVGANASVLGAISIADGARVGSGSVVIHDVPMGATVIGVPGRVVTAEHDRRHDDPLAHADLPDPVSKLVSELERLRDRVAALEKKR